MALNLLYCFRPADVFDASPRVRSISFRATESICCGFPFACASSAHAASLLHCKQTRVPRRAVISGYPFENCYSCSQLLCHHIAGGTRVLRIVAENALPTVRSSKTGLASAPSCAHGQMGFFILQPCAHHLLQAVSIHWRSLRCCGPLLFHSLRFDLMQPGLRIVSNDHSSLVQRTGSLSVFRHIFHFPLDHSQDVSHGSSGIEVLPR